MRKLNSIGLLILAVFIIATARASYTIYSNSIIVQSRDYVLTLASDYASILPRNSQVNFTATLSYGGSPVNGKMIVFYMNNTQVGDGITDMLGKAFFSYVLSAPGQAVYNFTCGYEVP